MTNYELKGAYSRLTPQNKAKVDGQIVKFMIWLDMKRSRYGEVELLRGLDYVVDQDSDDIDVDSLDLADFLQPAEL